MNDDLIEACTPASPEDPKHNYEREWDKEKSCLYQHAKRELELAGLFDKDSDYGGMVGEAVLRLMEAFAKEGHSGFSASWCAYLFARLAKYENLTPITDNPEDWMSVSEYYAEKSAPVHQCRRNPSLFSMDGGKTYHSVDDKVRKGFGIRLPRKQYRSARWKKT